jgi:hypothetical protein
MAQPEQASEQLKQYLAQFAPQVRGRLLAELERLHGLGETTPLTEGLIATLRAEFREPGQGPERIGEPARLFFQPLELVLTSGAPERANSGQIARGSLGPIWSLVKTELLVTMAREYVTNVSKVLINPKESEKLAAVFQKKALGYLDGTMRSPEGVAMVRSALRMYTGSPAIFDDLAKMFTVFRASEALAAFDRALPPKIGKLEDRALADVLKQINALKGAHADAVPFALTIVARRLATPWQLMHLATKTVESKAAAAIAAVPYALSVSMVLDQIAEKYLLLAVALRDNRVTVAKAILKEIYAIETALKAQIELGDSDWGKRLGDLMAQVAAALDAEVEKSRTNCGNLTHVLASGDLRPAQSLKDRLTEAVKKGRTMIADMLPA